MAAETQWIAFDRIVRDDRFQPRQRTDSRTVERYAAQMKAGEQFPPITVAKVDGVPHLIDGFHRLAALEIVGEQTWDDSAPTVEALVIECTEARAGWLAAEANRRHGLPLKSADVRKMFDLYMKADEYKDTRGRYKSYRTIAAELGGLKSHMTIIRWMKEKHPKIAFAMSGGETSAPGGLQDHPAKESGLVVAAIQDVSNALLRCEGITDPSERRRVIEATAGALRKMRGEPEEQPEISEQF